MRRSGSAAVVVAVALAVAGCAGSERGDARRADRPVATTRPTTTTAPVPGDEIAPGVRRLVVAPAHPDGYERDLFSEWTDPDGDCQDTRAEILIRSSATPVTFTRLDRCYVATGTWTDPWSGAVVTSARALQIDHTVPLANAWRSGAWSWTPEARVAYAIDVTDPGHLLAVSAADNSRKQDDGPEVWKPADRGRWCAYARVWTQIKSKWSLTATPEEWAAIVEMAATC